MTPAKPSQGVLDALADAETVLGFVIDVRAGWVGDDSLAALESAARAAFRAVPALRGDVQ